MTKIKQLKFFVQTSGIKTAREEFTSLLQDKKLKTGTQIIFVILSINFISLAFLWKKLPPEIPLFYSRPWGNEQLATKNLFLLLPVSVLILSVFNIRLASIFYRRALILSQMLVWSTAICCLLTSITLINIINIVL